MLQQTLHANAFLLAIGRVPTVKDLGLEEVGVEYTPERGIKVQANALAQLFPRLPGLQTSTAEQV